MEGILFYWVGWFYWIIVTFFVSKNNMNRMKLAIWLLLCIIFSIRRIDLFSSSFSLSSFFIILTVYCLASKYSWKKRLYFLISSFIVMLSYVSMLMFEIFDPVLLIFPREWLFPLFLTYCVFIMYNDTKMRILTLLSGTVHGEILFSFIVKKLTSGYTVGSLSYLDVVAITTAFILLWNGIEKTATYFNHHFSQIEKEKEKTS